jgi:hypothetical protein
MKHTNAIARSSSNLSTVCQGLSRTEIDEIGIVTKARLAYKQTYDMKPFTYVAEAVSPAVLPPVCWLPV